MKFIFSVITILFFSTSIVNAQTPARSNFRAYSNTQYTANSELFGEYRPLIQNQPGRFTAHLTKTGELFKAYTDAEVTLTLTIDGKTAFQQTLTTPAAPGTYRFTVSSPISGKGTATIALKTSAYSEAFTMKDVEVFSDSAAAKAAQGMIPNRPEGLTGYVKEKSWLVNFATETVSIKGNTIMIPKAAVIKKDDQVFVFVQYDPENFKKQTVHLGKEDGNKIIITNGLSAGDRIVVTGAEAVGN